MVQVEQYMEGEVRQHYFKLKSQYIELWDKVFLLFKYLACVQSYCARLLVCCVCIIVSMCCCLCLCVCSQLYYTFCFKVDALHGVGKVNIAPHNTFPSYYIPCRLHLTTVVVHYYWENKPHLICELRAMLSSHSLAVNHQRKVVKRTIGSDVVGHGG